MKYLYTDLDGAKVYEDERGNLVLKLKGRDYRRLSIAEEESVRLFLRVNGPQSK